MSEGARGAGLGERLVATFLREARRAGAEQFTLTTLEGAAGASAFYERLGWGRAGSRSNADGPRWSSSTWMPRLILRDAPRASGNRDGAGPAARGLCLWLGRSV
ncbi:MAG: GNAT family N-acetyltransferase [Thermoleophilaceae bacterium]|nr:GNAT family N-acetyltransferase [Thermoleophilaceae bacterium]